jgi:hypothetical protein
MSDITLEQGDEYVVFFTEGPFDGQTDRRVSTDGTWDDEITQLVLQNGKETQEVYAATAAQQVGDEVHVSYAWRPAESEPSDDARQHDLEEE